MDKYPDIESIFRFDVEEQKFKYYMKLKTGSFYGENFKLKPGEGIIFKIKYPLEIKIEGALASIDNFNLKPGFNFIGMPPLKNTISVTELFEKLPNTKSVFAWDLEQQKFIYKIKLNSGKLYGNNFELKSGYSYFINLETEGNLSVEAENTLKYAIDFFNQAVNYDKEKVQDQT